MKNDKTTKTAGQNTVKPKIPTKKFSNGFKQNPETLKGIKKAIGARYFVSLAKKWILLTASFLRTGGTNGNALFCSERVDKWGVCQGTGCDAFGEVEFERSTECFE